MRTKEISKLLNIGTQVVLGYAKELGIEIARGKTHEYTAEEVSAIVDHHAKVMSDKTNRIHEHVVYSKIRDDYRTRVSVYNPTLGRRVTLFRYQYCILKARGDWDNGVTRLPQGLVIHHIDGNTLNDELSNLQVMIIKDHRALHDEIGDRITKVTSAMTGRGRRQIRCVETGEVFNTGEDVVRALGAKSKAGLSMVLSGRQDTYHGKHFEYV